MADMHGPEARRKLAHDARQPLNTIRLITANLQVRLTRALDPDEAAAVNAKLEKIDRQVDRLVHILDSGI